MVNKLRFEYSPKFTGVAFLDFHFDILGFFWYNLFFKRPIVVNKDETNESHFDQNASYMQEEY